jgi:hypothetical protein
MIEDNLLFIWTTLYSVFMSSIVYNGIFHVFIKKHVYNWKGNDKMANRLLDIVENERLKFVIGTHIIKDRKVPLFVISPKFVLWASVSLGGWDSQTLVQFNFYQIRGQKDFIEDPMTPTRKTGGNWIRVVTNVSNNPSDQETRIIKQRAIPEGLPQEIMDNIKFAASSMLKLFADGNCFGKVFIISGRPGIGKSTAAREFTSKNHDDSCLVVNYNPTRRGDCFMKLVHDHSREDTSVLTIVVDEVNVMIDKILSKEVFETDSTIPDVLDKASWNSWLQEVQNIPNVVVIMTTNVPVHGILEMFKGDHSMVRDGRVHGIIDPEAKKVFVMDDRACLQEIVM